MIRILFFFGIFFLIIKVEVFSQKRISQRKSEMIRFLLKEGELDSTYTTFGLYVFERKILVKDLLHGHIYIFGSNSPHAYHYLALENKYSLKFLKTKDFAEDMKSILFFLKKERLESKTLIKVFLELSDTYRYNNWLHSQITLLPAN